jgi:hypothetical protein
MESVVRTTLRPFAVFAASAVLLIACEAARGDAIEAIKGKQYRLTRRHGPWMIMVASINRPPEDRRGEGLSPGEAADELVYELRSRGIPAYTFKQNEAVEQMETVDRRTGDQTRGRIKSHTEGICVLAGNYAHADDSVGQKTLKYIKRFHPQFLQDVAVESAPGQGQLLTRLKNGGLYRTTAARPGPLSGAFMTINPLLSEDEVSKSTRDPLILQLNSGSEYSLLTNPGKLTVVVATFTGKSHTQIANSVEEDKLEVSSALDDAAKRAWQLCSALRHARSLGYDREYEAYVYHDRFSSIVTVGAFSRPDEPGVREIQNTFGAKIASVNADGTPSIGAEVFAIPRKPNGKDPVQTWIFDPYPRLIEVPK